MNLGFLGRAVFLLAGALAAGAVAQTVGDSPSNPLNIPANAQIFGNGDPSIRKATAIVNGEIITGTDVDHRTELVLNAVRAEGKEPSPEEMKLVKEQVLRNLIDETLQIQAAAAEKIKVEQKEIDSYYQRFAESNKRTPKQFADYLNSIGSSERSIKRQIQGEMAWYRLQKDKISPFVNVAEEEVQAIIDRLKASKGATEYRVAEIFLSSTPETAAATRANANRIIEQLGKGGSFAAYARQFSEASTAVVGGDLGWVRAEQLPEALAEVVRTLPAGRISNPIPIPGGYSIIAVLQSRKILSADPLDAVLNLKQIAISFPAGTTPAQREQRTQELINASRTMGGCGGVEATAVRLGGAAEQGDMRARDLPEVLQSQLLNLGIGQASPPFGTREGDGVRILVLCGRDDPEDDAEDPSFDKLYRDLEEEKVNRRAQRYLRDLRRDAVIEYR